MTIDLSRLALSAPQPRVSAPGDASEREADAVAERIMKGDAKVAVWSAPSGVVGRKCSSARCEEDRVTVQTKRADGAGSAPLDVGSAVRVAEGGGGEPLPRSVRAQLEPQFGRDFGGVRVHVGEEAASAARGVRARAYTVGQDIVFARGEYAPSTREGQRLLAHELTHVVQQGGSAGWIQREEDPAELDSKPKAPEDLPPCPSMADPNKRQQSDAMRCRTSLGGPLRCALTDWHMQRIEAAERSAKETIRKARERLGIMPQGRFFALDLGRKIFGKIVKADRIGEVLGSAQAQLDSRSLRFAGVTCADLKCGVADYAFVDAPGKMPIYLCPRVFLPNAPLARTLIHEALHLAGLDKDRTNEEHYCSVYDCETQCYSDEVVDAWAHLIDCLGEPIGARRSEGAENNPGRASEDAAPGS